MTAQLTPRRGRPMAAETLPERVEGHVYGVLTELASARTALRERFPSHDAAADAAVAQVVRTARTSLLRHDDPLVRLAGRAILAFCADYATHDRLEDAEVGAAAGRVEHAAWEGRQSCALIEFAATGRARGRLPRRATNAGRRGRVNAPEDQGRGLRRLGGVSRGQERRRRAEPAVTRRRTTGAFGCATKEGGDMRDWAPGPQDVPHDDDGEDDGDGLVTVALLVMLVGVVVIVVAYLWLVAAR